MLDVKKLTIQGLRRLRLCSRASYDTVACNVQNVFRNALLGFENRIYNPVELEHLRLTIVDNLAELEAERVIYRGTCDTVQIVDGQLRVSINIVPNMALETIVFDCRLTHEGVQAVNGPP